MPLAWILIAALLTAGGCTYYQITDLQSDKVFYTDNWKFKNVESGAIVFKDAVRGSKITLSSHAIDKISRRQYQAAVESQAVE
jgi:hypothetical protein